MIGLIDWVKQFKIIYNNLYCWCEYKDYFK